MSVTCVGMAALSIQIIGAWLAVTVALSGDVSLDVRCRDDTLTRMPTLSYYGLSCWYHG